MEQAVEADVVGPNTELLAAFGLTVERASRYLPHTRAAIEAGFSKDNRGGVHIVLDLDDVIELRLHQLLKSEPCDEEAVLRCVRRRFGSFGANVLRTTFAQMATQSKLEELEEFWFLCPNPRELISTPQFEHVRNLLKLPGQMMFLTGDPVGEEHLRKALGEEDIASKGDAIDFGWDTPINSWGTMLIGDPTDKKSVYMLGTNGFVLSPLLEGNNFVFILKERGRIFRP